jgi:hypothetical protein
MIGTSLHPIAVSSAALFAALHDRLVQALAQTHRHLVDLVGPVDLDCLAGGVQRDFAMVATTQMILQIGAHLGSHRVVDQVIEHCQKLSARHFSLPLPWKPSSA